jgi:hypothetical protein
MKGKRIKDGGWMKMIYIVEMIDEKIVNMNNFDLFL